MSLAGVHALVTLARLVPNSFAPQRLVFLFC